jgi:hypothetical protein
MFFNNDKIDVFYTHHEHIHVLIDGGNLDTLGDCVCVINVPVEKNLSVVNQTETHI